MKRKISNGAATAILLVALGVILVGGYFKYLKDPPIVTAQESLAMMSKHYASAGGQQGHGQGGGQNAGMMGASHGGRAAGGHPGTMGAPHGGQPGSGNAGPPVGSGTSAKETPAHP